MIFSLTDSIVEPQVDVLYLWARFCFVTHQFDMPESMMSVLGFPKMELKRVNEEKVSSTLRTTFHPNFYFLFTSNITTLNREESTAQCINTWRMSRNVVKKLIWTKHKRSKRQGESNLFRFFSLSLFNFFSVTLLIHPFLVPSSNTNSFWCAVQIIFRLISSYCVLIYIVYYVERCTTCRNI